MGDLAIRRSEPVAPLSTDQLKFIANTEFVPKSLRGNVPAIMACVAYGRAIGIPDMVALQKIYMIDGRPAMAAEMMVQLVRGAGHSISGSTSAKSATAKGKRGDTGDEMSYTFTIEMAERAGLLSKPPYQRYPESQLWARAVSQLCRMLFADCLGGVSYTPEEAELSPEERVAEALATAVPADTEQPDDTVPALEPGPPVASPGPEAGGPVQGAEESTGGEPGEASVPSTVGEQTSFAEMIPKKARRT